MCLQNDPKRFRRGATKFLKIAIYYFSEFSTASLPASNVRFGSFFQNPVTYKVVRLLIVHTILTLYIFAFDTVLLTIHAGFRGGSRVWKGGGGHLAGRPKKKKEKLTTIIVSE